MVSVLILALLQEIIPIFRGDSVKNAMMIVKHAMDRLHFNVFLVEQVPTNCWYKIPTVILYVLSVQSMMEQVRVKIASTPAKHAVIPQKSNVLLVKKISFLIMSALPIHNVSQIVLPPKLKILLQKFAIQSLLVLSNSIWIQRVNLARQHADIVQDLTVINA